MAALNIGKVGFVTKGQYSADTTYTKQDCVLYNGTTYVAKKTAKGVLPTNTEYWQIMVDNTAINAAAANANTAADAANAAAASAEQAVAGMVKYTAQTLTSAQQAQARANIGAGDAEEVADLKSAIDGIDVVKSAGGVFLIIDDATASNAKIGSMIEVRRTGVNYWDEVWEPGYINTDTGEDIAFANRIRSKNYIPCIAGQVLYYYNGDNVPIIVVFYGVSKNRIGATETSQGGTITIPNNCYYFRFYLPTLYGGEYKGNVCLNIYDVRFNGTYYSANVKTSNTGEIALTNGYNTILSVSHGVIVLTYHAGNFAVSYLPHISLLSYNIRCLRGGEYDAGYDALTEEQTVQTLSNFKTLFQKLKPDIFVVCEDRTWFDTDAFALTGGAKNVYEMLFAHYFPYKFNLETGANAPHIYSKYPIIASGQIEPVYASGITNKKPPYIAINVLGNIVYIIGAHPSSDASAYESERVPYFNAIVSFCADKSHVVIAGDFNTDSATPESELSVFTNAGMELGNMGYFGKFATYRWGTAVYIDNIVTKGMILNNYTVGDETYSDHFPVSGELNVKL